MSKTRVYELAKEIGIDNKEMISRLEKLGIAVKSHSSSLEDSDVERVRNEFRRRDQATVVEERVKRGVIRRRTVHQAVEELPPEDEVPEVPPEPVPEPVAPPMAAKEEEGREKVREGKKAEEVGVKEAAAAAPVHTPPPSGVRPAEKAAPRREEGPAKRPARPEAPRVIPGKEKKETPARSKETPSHLARKEQPLPRQAEAKPGTAREKLDEFKGRKKPVEVLVEEVPARKRSFVKQRIDKKERRVTKDRGDTRDVTEAKRGWREEKKEVLTHLKTTEITTPKAIKRRLKVQDEIQVGEMAKRMGVKASEVISKLMAAGLMVSINQSIDVDTATLIAGEFGYQVESLTAEFEEVVQRVQSSPEKLCPRAPVVTIMVHVDHGKTSLLDAVRETHVTDEESGGITQSIGAYRVTVHGRDIVFLDTPGHEAFTAMRARGAKVTDIVVLVVAADDGVMDQTVEAINHARAAGVPIMVAVNKIDKPGADTDRVKNQLTEMGLVPEAWGGETIYAEVSAKKKTGIQELMELILLQADVLELKADPDKPAHGVIIESKLDRGRGPVATVIVQEGTLKEGDAVVSRKEYARVRAIIDDKGNRVKAAGPSTPVEVIGFSDVPQAGMEFACVEDDKMARSISDYWTRKERERDLSKTSKITLDQLYARIKEGAKEFAVIIKADAQGSVEALAESLGKLATENVRVKVIHASTGAVTESDVMLASASDAIIIGFKVRPDSRIKELADREGVEIKYYDVIYNVTTDVRAAMEGLLEPVYVEVVQGHAEVRQVFKIPKVGAVAGSFVTDGKIARNASLRLLRDGVVIFDGKILSLKRFKDDAREVAEGFECGIGIENFNDVKENDVIESYVQEEVKRRLE
ncbi:MAG: translation initiation factor IF-2 [Deltaproteobacteria bacterium]|nr:translation initiation factor IF-2 [Deltaproteobacteria bacterium]